MSRNSLVYLRPCRGQWRQGNSMKGIIWTRVNRMAIPTITRYKAHPYPWIAKRGDNIHDLLNAESFLSFVPAHWNNTRVCFCQQEKRTRAFFERFSDHGKMSATFWWDRKSWLLIWGRDLHSPNWYLNKVNKWLADLICVTTGDTKVLPPLQQKYSTLSRWKRVPFGAFWALLCAF